MKKYQTTIKLSLLSFLSFLLNPSLALAQRAPDAVINSFQEATEGQQTSGGLTNPAIDSALGEGVEAASSGATFLSYFITIWRALITVGSLAVIIMFLWGAIDWITAGGDSGKVGKARDKITQAVIGMVILVGSFIIIGFVGQLFFEGFDLLNLTIPTPADITN